MGFKWLEDFLSLAGTHSFSRSAELRGVTPSAFSRRIRALEDWLTALPAEVIPENGQLRTDLSEIEGLKKEVVAR